MSELNRIDVKRRKTAEIIFSFTLTNALKEVSKVIKGGSSCCNEAGEERAGMSPLLDFPT